MSPSPERARAVVRVEPNHAACYWQAISATLVQLGAPQAQLEVSVVDVAHEPDGEGSHLVLLQMSSAALDQDTLEAAIRETRLLCEGSVHRPVGDVAADVTVHWPLGIPLDQTIEAPLRPET